MNDLADKPPAPRAIDVFDRASERSVVNLVPLAVQGALFESAKKREDLFQLEEQTLYKTLVRENCTPGPTVNRLRLSFWLEYDRAQEEGRDMNMTHVVAGVCTRQYFYTAFLKNAAFVAWLMCPPSSYTTKIEEALDFGLDQLRDILEIPHTNESGGVNTKLGELKAKIVAMLDTRAKGAIVQKSMNLSIHSSDKSVATAELGNSMEDLSKRLKELELRERKALHLETPVEVTDEAELVEDEN